MSRCGQILKYAHYGQNMLIQGRLLPMIPPDFAIFDLRIGFYASKNLRYVFSNRLCQLHHFLPPTSVARRKNKDQNKIKHQK